MSTFPPGDVDGVIFRRFRTGPGGKKYDAWDYGLSAWPIRIRKGQRKKR